MKILRRMACAALALLLLGAPLPVRAQTFTDVSPDAWFYESVEKAAGRGWLEGVGSGRYNPDCSMAYTDFIKMLTATFYKAATDTCEVPSGSVWWLCHLETAEREGLLKNTYLYDVLQDIRKQDPEGCGDWVAAGVEHGVSRYEMAQILLNLARSLDISVDTDSSAVRDQIADWSKIPTRYRKAVAACYQAGLLKGTNKGVFDGDGVVSRAQGATILCRLCELADPAA